MLLASLLAYPALAQLPAVSFTATQLYSTGVSNGNGSAPTSIVLADVNNDGKPDILTANSGTNSAGVFLGEGTGEFKTSSPFFCGAQPFGIAVADVNNDGHLDLLTANASRGDVGVLLGTGTGAFGTVTSFSSGFNSLPYGIAVADVNGDGKLDLLTANFGSKTVGVLLGTGTGTFGTARTFSTGDAGPYDIAVADVNGDGRPDLLTANPVANAVGVLLNTGTGSFGVLVAFTPVTFSAGIDSQPYMIAVADVNGDGKPDLLTANHGSNTVGVLLGTGTGTFGTVTTFSVGAGSRPSGIAVADVNGDGKPDLLTANTGSNTVGVLLGTGTGTFDPVTTFSSVSLGREPTSIAVADVNGDGKPDLLITNYGSSNGPYAGFGTVGVLLNTTVLATRAVLPGASASLAPNPAVASTGLAATGLPALAQRLDATLYNALGQVVRRLALPLTAGAGQAPLSTAGLPTGTYLLRLVALDAQGATLGALPTQHLAVQ